MSGSDSGEGGTEASGVGGEAGSGGVETSTGGAEAGTGGAAAGGTPGNLPIEGCDSIPAMPTSSRILDAPRGYHDLAITPTGEMIGADPQGNLLKASSATEATLFVPNVGTTEQMDWLPGGDLVFSAEDGSLQRLSLAGERSLLSSDVSAYAVVTGPDGMVYTIADTPTAELVRVDPTTGDKETLLAWNDGSNARLHTLAFSLDNQGMFLGTIGDGKLLYVDLDAQMNLVGEPELFAEVPERGNAWHDAIGVDRCGNLYVADFISSNLYRVTSDGEVSLLFTGGITDFPHGIVWGNGVGDWLTDALYLPLPYADHQVLELVIGVTAAGE